MLGNPPTRPPSARSICQDARLGGGGGGEHRQRTTRPLLHSLEFSLARQAAALQVGSAKATGCTIVAEDAALGIVTCVAQAAEFGHVAVQWSPSN